MQVKLGFELVFSHKSDQFFQNIPIRIQNIELRLVGKSELPLKIERAGIVSIQIGKSYAAKILCFKPMNHGRHGAASPSGKTEKFNQLQLARR